MSSYSMSSNSSSSSRSRAVKVNKSIVKKVTIRIYQYHNVYKMKFNEI